jgi:hypothetical protein
MSILLLPLALVVLFALFLTAHLALAWGLLIERRPNWQGLLVLLPPLAWLAPYWGLRHGMRVRSWLWLGSLLSYCVVRAAAAWLT